MSTSKLFIRTPYNYDADEASLISGLACSDPSLAQQSSRDETDINVILKRFGQGVSLPENFRAPSYGDFEGITDYHTAMNAVAMASEAFDSMPADLRARFDNNPGKLMAFLDEPNNRSEAEKLGLLRVPPIPASENLTEAPLEAPIVKPDAS